MRIRFNILFLIAGLTSLSLFAGPNNQNEFDLFPNPVTDGQLTIKSDKEIEKIEVVSIVGEVIHVYNPSALNSVEINMDLQSGLYLIRFSFTDNTKNIKRFWVN